jgi:hypothetical protein
MISIKQAAAQGISLIRKPNWVNPADHLKIDIIDGKPGPWVHLYSPVNEMINGRNPVGILQLDGLDEECFEPWSGEGNEP